MLVYQAVCPLINIAYLPGFNTFREVWSVLDTVPERTTAVGGVVSSRGSVPWLLASCTASANFSVKAWLTFSGTENWESSSIRLWANDFGPPSSVILVVGWGRGRD